MAVITDDGGSPLETYSYGASNERLLTVYGNNLGAPATYYCWEGGQVISDFRAGTSSNLVWEKSYVYLGGRLLATADINGTKYHHQDRLGTRLVTDGTNGNVTTEQCERKCKSDPFRKLKTDPPRWVGVPLEGLSLVYTNTQSQTVSNRITSTGYEYDPAGNQTRGQTENGTWRRYKYDSAGRLAVALDDGSNPQETYSYGASKG